MRLLEVARALDTRAAWRLNLAGDGPLKAHIASEVRARGLADRVRFVGTIEDSRSFWSSQDIGLSSPTTRAPRTRCSRQLSLPGRSSAPVSVECLSCATRREDPSWTLATRRASRAPSGSSSTIPSRDGRRAKRHTRRSPARFSMDACARGHLAAIERAIREGRDGKST